MKRLDKLLKKIRKKVRRHGRSRELQRLLKQVQKKIRHLRRIKDRARRELEESRLFLIGSMDIVSLRDSMATSLFKEIEAKMERALREAIQEDVENESVLELVGVNLDKLRRGRYMQLMTRLCLGVSQLRGRQEAAAFALIKATKDKVFHERYGQVTIHTHEFRAAFEAFYNLRGARNESAHLFERVIYNRCLPDRNWTRRLILQDLSEALKNGEVSARLWEMAPVLKLEVQRWLHTL